MTFERLCVLLLTYNRLDYAKRTLRAVLDNVIFSGDLHVHIGSDGDTSEYTSELQHLAGSYGAVHSVGISNSERGGYGKSYNLATQTIHQFADLVLQVEDDWLLTRKLNIDLLSEIFDEDRIGCIRLGYLGGTQPLYGEVLRVQGQPVLLLDPLSPEPHVWCGHPQLAKVSWQQQVGPWPEGLSAQATEFYVSTKLARRGVVWPMYVNPDGDLFQHFGSLRAE